MQPVRPERRLGPREAGLLRNRQLAELGPVVLRDREVDDARRCHQVRRQGLLRGLEVVRLHMRRTRRAVAEGFDEYVFGRVVDAAGPVEPQTSGLVACRLGERPGDLRPGVGVPRSDPELCGNEDHAAPRSRGFFRPGETHQPEWATRKDVMCLTESNVCSKMGECSMWRYAGWTAPPPSI